MTTKRLVETWRHPDIELKRCSAVYDKTNMAYSGDSVIYMRMRIERRQSLMTQSRMNRTAALSPHSLPIASIDYLVPVPGFLLQLTQNLQLSNGPEMSLDQSFAAVERSRGEKLELHASDRTWAMSPSLTRGCLILSLQNLPAIVDARCNAHFPQGCRLRSQRVMSMLAVGEMALL